MAEFKNTTTWTYDNRDSITVKDASCFAEAYDAAATFLDLEISESSHDYFLLSDMEGGDTENNTYVFRVRCYDK